MDSLSRLDITSSGKGKRLASWSNSEFRRSRWRLDGLDLAPSMGGGLTLEIKTFLQFSWIHLCLSLAYGSIIEASHTLFHFTFRNIDTHTHTLYTLSLSLSHTQTHIPQEDCWFIYLCIFKCLSYRCCMFVFLTGAAVGDTLHISILFCPFITSYPSPCIPHIM